MKFERVKGNVPVFSQDYDGRDRTIFGGAEQSNDINQQFTPEFIKGWGIVGKNEFPTLQDFNALGFTHSALIGYLYQSGVAQWVAGADYYAGSVAVQGVDLYVAIQDKPTGAPNTLQGWRLVSPALLNTTGQSATAPMTQKAVTDALDKKWGIQTTTGSGNVVRMSEVQKKADLSYVNTELDKKRDLTNAVFDSNVITLDRPSVFTYIQFKGNHQFTKGWLQYSASTEQFDFQVRAKTGSTVFNQVFVPKGKSGTLALTSDVIGIDQTWQDMTSQRVAGTTYTNNTGKPISVSVSYAYTTGNNVAGHSFYVGGILVARSVTRYSSDEKVSSTNVIVPPHSSYYVSNSSGSLLIWAELRS